MCADGSEHAGGESMEKDDLVHDMEAVSPRSFQDGLPVSQERILKFELQLYKLKDSEYLLDVQVRLLCPPAKTRNTILLHEFDSALYSMYLAGT